MDRLIPVVCALSLGLVAESAEVVSPKDGMEVPLLNAAQKHYYSLPRAEREKYFADAEKDKPLAFRKYGTWPEPVRLRWRPEAGETSFDVKVVRMPDGKPFFRATKSATNEVEVWNLEIGREWEWSVAAGGRTSRGRFRTEEQAPRMLRIDNIKNCRDLGGRIGLDGRRVRQGLLIRTQGLNGNAKFKREKGERGKIIEPPTKRGEDRLTPEARRYLTEELGVRTDIDLRNEYECFGMDGSPLGPGVRWEHLSLLGAYNLICSKDPRETLTKVLRLMLDEKNYPIVFHCIGGADRTGCIAYALEGLLGVAEEEMWLDWETTAFGNSFRSGGLADQKHRNWFKKLAKGFDAYPGATVRERVEAGFRSLGFTDADFEKFRSIMLEPADAVRTRPTASIRPGAVSRPSARHRLGDVPQGVAGLLAGRFARRLARQQVVVPAAA